MSERVRIYVGDRLTDITGRQKPTIAFDLMPGVELVDALGELVGSMKRRDRGEIVAGPPPSTSKPSVDVRDWLALQLPSERFDPGTDIEENR